MTNGAAIAGAAALSATPFDAGAFLFLQDGVDPPRGGDAPALNARARGWLRFLWEKTTTPDDWSRSGTPHPWWDVYSAPGVQSYGRFDLQYSSYALLLMADQTPAWRVVYTRIADGLASRFPTYWGAIDWLTASVRNLDNPPPAWITFDVDAVVLAVTVGATLVAAIGSGLLPAWMSSRANAITVLREGGRGNTNRTVSVISRSLVVFQIVVTCVLLIGSLLQTRSILKQQAINYGYDTHGLLSARMGLMEGDYPSADARKLFYGQTGHEKRTARSAVLFAWLYAHQPEFKAFLNDLGADLLLLVHLADVRFDLGLREFTDARPEQFFLFRQNGQRLNQ